MGAMSVLRVALALSVLALVGCAGASEVGDGQATHDEHADATPAPAAGIRAGDELPATPLPPDEDPGLVHVHGLGIDPGDGALMIATHFGLWRLSGSGPAERVGDAFHDLMGFTVVGADHYLASGHPVMVGNTLPPLLGLIETDDGGQTWRSVSLMGEVDFHGLRSAHDRIWGWSATDGRFLVSAEGQEWETRSGIESLVDFVVDPQDADRIVASVARTRDALAVVTSDDGGISWGELDGAPDLARFAWESLDRLWGVGPEGAVWRSDDGGVTWSELGTAGGWPEAVFDDGEQLYVSVAGAISASADGTDWQELYRDG